LIAAADGQIRDRCLLLLVIATGLRASELCALRVGDLVIDDEGDLLIHVRQGKGRKDRIVPLARETAKEVRSFLASRRLKVGRDRDADDSSFHRGKGQNE